ncbi:ret finger protein-like 4A [Dasypus novemcinctus]|uniref:ret finger protein-like 4A n=1 Tax=Dasypus novemcinctus TaxID=9361 RepID=UPI00265FC28D|nr:ret finger protein-like 4A [Dasypus novemcinctus]
MTEHFREASSCPICLAYFEKPVYLKCGYVCYHHYINSLTKDSHQGSFLCPFYSVDSQKDDIRTNCQLWKLVSKIKELEPHLRSTLQMNPRMLKFQVDMTLDLDTAHNHLIISDDLKQVRCGLNNQQREERAERFTYGICVLGSSRFTSGRQYWEVDVGTSREWSLGVCKESVQREGIVFMSSELGFWTLNLRKGKHFSASTKPKTILCVNPRLHRVGIFLDLDIGNITFCNVSDGSHIFTFTKISVSEPLRPIFVPESPGNDDRSFLSICPPVISSISIFQHNQK